MNAAQFGLGTYTEPSDGGWSYEDDEYWRKIVRPRALRAIGIHEFGEEARRRMRPDSPDLAADRLHPWVWEAAAPLWYAGNRQEAVHAAARSVNARMQQKRDRLQPRAAQNPRLRADRGPSQVAFILACTDLGPLIGEDADGCHGGPLVPEV
jgi:hypothetical protein